MQKEFDHLIRTMANINALEGKRQQLRIAHILAGRCNPDSANGIDKVVYHLSKGQAAHGHRIGVWGISPRPAIPIPGVEARTSPPAQIPLLPPPKIIRELERFRPDIVHLHFVFSPPCTAIGRVLRRRGIPYVVTPHGGIAPNAIRQRPVRKAIYGRLFEARHLKGAVAVHAVCDGEATDLREYGISTPVFVAPHGVDFDAIPRDLNPSLLADQIPQVRGKRVFMFLGRLAVWQKGLDLLIDGVSQARHDLAGAVVVIVGPDWRGNQATLEARVAAANLKDLVVFAGPRFGREKFDFLAAADLIVLPSRWDVMPTGLLEAMACGTPCLITEATNLGSVVRRHTAGTVVEPTARAISEGLTAMARMDLSELKAMGDRARHAMRSEFTWEATASTVINHYAANGLARSAAT